MNTQDLNFKLASYIKYPFQKNLELQKYEKSDSTTLIIVLHGVGSSQTKLEGLAMKIIEEYPHADIWAPVMPYKGLCGLFSFASADNVVDQLCDDLDQIWDSSEYERLIIVGHSLGGLYARALWLRGISNQKEWSQNAENCRIVLLAAVNRGTGITRHMSIGTIILIWIYIRLDNLLSSFSPKFTFNLFETMRGSDFVTRLRLRWQKMSLSHPMPTVVQLLGSEDDIVGPNDSLDLVTGANFIYLDVPHTGHGTIIEINPDYSDRSSLNDIQLKRFEDRWNMIKIALSEDEKEIKQVRPWDLKRPTEIKPKEEAEKDQVVFVIHGIRDHGYWTDKIARRIWQRWDTSQDKAGELYKVVESYGFFGMGPFLFPQNRRKKVHWFMEQYIKARNQHPYAKFHFIGHSHGTYLLAKSLELYEDCEFSNVVFAGSIVRNNYEWIERQEKGQIEKLLNFQATHDWVVAFFPRFFDIFNFQDLGGAGHNGFTNKDKEKKIFSVEFAIGDHGAGKREELWDEISDFVLSDQNAPLPEAVSNLVDNREGAEENALSEARKKPFSLIVAAFSPINILVFFAILFLIVVLVPTLIVAYIGPTFALAFQSFKQLITLPVLLILSAFSGIAAFVLIVQGQSGYRRSYSWLRTGLGLGAIGFIGFVLIWLFNILIQTLKPDHSILDANLISITNTGLIMVWAILIIWILRKL